MLHYYNAPMKSARTDRMHRVIAATIAVVVLVAAPGAAADGPMRIAVLVDTSAGTRDEMPQLRRGLTALIAAIPADQEIALISTGRNVQTRVPPTLDRKKLQNSINGLLAGDGPTPLMDALVEVDERFMRMAGDRSPLFVIVTGDGSESSKLIEGEAFNRWLATLLGRRVVAHAIVLKKANGIPEVIAAAVARATGGHFETVGTGPVLAARLQSLGEQIAASLANQRR
jgi:hypothetical protein